MSHRAAVGITLLVVAACAAWVVLNMLRAWINILKETT